MIAARPLGGAVAAASLALLAAAFWFQHVGGLDPCALCVWQRWPHVAAVALAGLGWRFGWRWATALAGVALLGGAGLALFHVGVEQGWWRGLSTCSAGPIDGLSTDALLAAIRAAPVTRCDAIAWSFLGLSMAAWNGLASLGLAALAGVSATAGTGRPETGSAPRHRPRR